MGFVSQALDTAEKRDEGLSGFVLDVIKAFNAIFRKLALFSMQKMGLPAK